MSRLAIKFQKKPPSLWSPPINFDGFILCIPKKIRASCARASMSDIAVSRGFRVGRGWATAQGAGYKGRRRRPQPILDQKVTPIFVLNFIKDCNLQELYPNEWIASEPS